MPARRNVKVPLGREAATKEGTAQGAGPRRRSCGSVHQSGDLASGGAACGVASNGRAPGARLRVAPGAVPDPPATPPLPAVTAIGPNVGVGAGAGGEGRPDAIARP